MNAPTLEDARVRRAMENDSELYGLHPEDELGDQELQVATDSTSTVRR